MTRFLAGDLARQKPHLVCTDCEKEVGSVPEAEQWVFHVNRYYCSRCAEAEGLY